MSTCMWNHLVNHNDEKDIRPIDISVGYSSHGWELSVGVTNSDRCDDNYVATYGVGVGWQPGQNIRPFIYTQQRRFDAQYPTDGSARPTQVHGGGYAQGGLEVAFNHDSKKYSLKSPFLNLGGTLGIGAVNVNFGPHLSYSGNSLYGGIFTSTYDFGRGGGILPLVLIGAGG